MADDQPLWDKLAGMAAAAAARGDGQRARELGFAARDAWLGHCEAVEAQQRGKRLAHRHAQAVEDYEYEQDLERGRRR